MVKNLPAMQETGVQSPGQDDPLEKGMATPPAFFPGEFHGERSLVGYSPWGCKESDTTEWLTISLFISALVLALQPWAKHLSILGLNFFHFVRDEYLSYRVVRSDETISANILKNTCILLRSWWRTVTFSQSVSMCVMSHDLHTRQGRNPHFRVGNWGSERQGDTLKLTQIWDLIQAFWIAVQLLRAVAAGL